MKHIILNFVDAEVSQVVMMRAQFCSDGCWRWKRGLLLLIYQSLFL